MVNSSTNNRLISWEKGVPEVVNEALEISPDATLLDLGLEWNERDEHLFTLDLQPTTFAKGLEFRSGHHSELRVTYGACNRCSRQYGTYYEATIQFRGGRRPPSEEELTHVEEYVQRRFDESNAENGFITSMGRIHKGVNFVLGDKTLAKEVARELQQHFGGSFQESHSQAGRRDGVDIYRSTYLIRLPEYRNGDFVEFQEKVYLLEKVGERSMSMVNLLTGTVEKIGEKERNSLKLLHGDVMEAVVVARGEGEIQMLDPVNFRTMTVLAPGQVKDNESLKVFRYDENLYLHPSEYER